MFKLPIWITNFKNYEQCLGKNAITMAKIHEKVARETGASIAVAVSPLDVYRVAKEVSIPVLCQHSDAVDYGKHTGYILPQEVKQSGGVGVLLNHSEHRFEDFDTLKRAQTLAQKTSLSRIVCAENPEELGKFAEMDPDFLAFEPPELIGSTGASVASSKTGSIVESVKLSRGIPVLVGAGINSVEDVKTSLKLGAQGFLVATAITKSSDPEKALREFVEAF